MVEYFCEKCQTTHPPGACEEYKNWLTKQQEQEQGQEQEPPFCLRKIPHAMTLDEYMSRMTSERQDLKEKTKDKARLAKLKIRRIKNPEKVLALIKYLEETGRDIEIEEEVLGEVEAEQKAKDYKEQGYQVKIRKLDSGRQKLTVRKESPVRFNMKNSRVLAELLNSPNDPIEFFERLRDLNYLPSSEDITDFLKYAIGKILSIPQINRFLGKLQAMNRKSDRPRRILHLSEEIEDLAVKDGKNEILTTEAQRKLLEVSSILGHQISDNEIKQWIELAQEENNLIILPALRKTYKYHGYDGSDSDRYDSYNEEDLVSALKTINNEGLGEVVATLVSEGFDLSDLGINVGFIGLSEKMNKFFSNIRSLVESRKYKDLKADKVFFEFVQKVSKILEIGVQTDPKTIANFKELQKIPEALAALEFFSEIGIFKGNFGGLENITELLKQKDKLAIVLEKDYQDFLRTIRNQLAYKFSVGDVFDDAYKIYQNQELRSKILSDNGLKVLKKLGHFSFHECYKDFFKKVLDTPDALEILEKMEENFDYHWQGVNSDDGTSQILFLLEDSEFRNKLFDPQTIELFNRLKKYFTTKYFKINLKITEGEDLISLAQNKDLQEKLFNKETLRFIDLTAHYHDIPTIKALAELDPNLRPVIEELSEEFGCKMQLNRPWKKEDRKLIGIEQITKLRDQPELLDKLLEPSRLELIHSLFDNRSWEKFSPEHIELLLSLPLDFNKLIDALKQHQYSYSFSDVKDIQKLCKYSLTEVETLLENIKNIIGDAASVFSKDKVDGWVILLDKKCGADEIKQIKEVFAKYSSDYREKGWQFDLTKIEKALALIKNDGQLLKLVERLEEFGVSTDNLLESLWMFEEIIKDNFKEIINQYQVFFKYTQIVFNFKNIELYRRLVEIDDLEEKLKNLTPEDVNKMNDKRELLIFLACEFDLEKINAVNSVIKSPYFVEGKDAKNNLEKFLKRAEKGNYSNESFVKIMTLPVKAREIKRLLVKIMAIEDVQEVLDPQEKIDYTLLLEANKYPELLATANRFLVERVSQLLFVEEDKETVKSKQEEIERLLKEDEKFEDDLMILVNSVAIYSQKYPLSRRSDSQKTQEKFNELIGAIRKTLELNFTRDPEKYKQERFRRSKDQFDRIFEKATDSNKNRTEVEEAWLDTSLVITDFLDGSSTSEKQQLRNKIEEINVTFKDEILPNLLRFFMEKIADLEKKIAAGEGDIDFLKRKVEIFKKYILDENGEVRKDLVDVYRSLARDIKEQERLLKSKEVNKERKSEISRYLRTTKSLKEVLKAIYILINIRPDRIDESVDYVERVDKVVDLLSSNLDKLGIVDKNKKSLEELEESDLTEEPVDLLEREICDHLSHLEEIIGEKDLSRGIEVQTEFVVGFNDLARCPELTGSCQRLTEVTGHNQSAYSRILDGINELIDVWEIKRIKSRDRKQKIEKKQRLARSFTELVSIKLPGENNFRLAVSLDRPYFHPDHSSFQHKFREKIIEIAIKRFADKPELSILLPESYFNVSVEFIKKLASKFGYHFREVKNITYFVNESQLKIEDGKYYDSMGGHKDTKESHETTMSRVYILEKI